MSELIDMFLEITSTTDKDIATNFLEMSGNNLETAVALYFEHGATASSNNNNNNNISNIDSGDAGSSNITSSNSTNRNTPAPGEDDEAFAQRLQNEMYQQDGGNHNSDNNSGNDEPPRPIEPIHDQLLPSYSDYNQLHSDHFGFGNSRNSRNASSLIFGADPSGIFNQTDYSDGRRRAGGYYNDDDDDDDDDYENGDNGDDDGHYHHYNQARHDATNGVVFGSDDEEDSSNHDVSVEFRRPMNRRARRISNRDDGLTATQRRLAEMFKPPWDIITKADLETAKNLARSNQKWILINIQLMSDFRCQVLNRDFWSNMEIKDLVRENFIFLQYHSSSPSGEIYKNLYPFTDFPHIAILDPMTGERLKMWSDVPKVDKFIEQVVEFLDKFGLDKNHKNPIVKHKTKIDPSSLSEEQQINMAIKKSLNHDEDNDDVVVLENNSENNPIFIDSDDNESIESVEFESDDEEGNENKDHQMLSRLPSKMDLGEDLSNANNTGAQSAATTSISATEAATTTRSTPADVKVDTANATYSEILATILPKDHDDAPNDPKLTTRIQIRSGDGTRIVKRFNLTDSVAKIYEVVKFNFPNTKEHDFRLTAQRDDLFNHFDEDIETAGLKNASVLLDIEED